LGEYKPNLAAIAVVMLPQRILTSNRNN